MREIKFRCWDWNRGKMQEVQVICGKPCIVWFGDDSGCTRDDHITYQELDGDGRIMQYTGIKDKNGKEIYEGDIVKLPKCDNATKIVEKWRINYRLKGFGRTVSERWGIEFDEVCNPDCFEVVGNIYENQELLEQ